jgi:UDP-N-acetylglucosamine--N-acetylmuramyl-(pentapeptide) pyrophosphoryl-undecaprenol N-acetylglucosamine transferase
MQTSTSDNAPADLRRIALAGGGTGGHVRAALAVAEAYRALMGNVEVLYFGARQGFRFESRLIAGADDHLELIDARPVMGMGLAGMVRAAASLVRGILQARRLLRSHGVQLVIGFGGYATPAVILAAKSLGQTTAIHEANVVPGRANRLLRRFATHVFLGTAEADAPPLSPSQTIVGYPIGSDMAALMDEPHSAPDLDSRPARILVAGGSLGSDFLNRESAGLMAILHQSGLALDIVHQTGEARPDAVTDAYNRLGVEANVMPYLDDMADRYRWADFVICTAGAGTLAEIAVAGLPALIVPLGWVADDHQTANARSHAAAGGAWLASETDWNVAEQAERIAALLRDPQAWQQASIATRSLARPHAALAIAQHCEDMLAAGNFRP